MNHPSHTRLLTAGALTVGVAAVLAAAPLAANAAVRDPVVPVVSLTRIDDGAATRPLVTTGQSRLLTRIGDQLVRGDDLTGARSASGLTGSTSVRHSADVAERLALGPQAVAGVRHSADVLERLATGSDAPAPTTVHHSADVTERLATPPTPPSRLPRPNAPR
ncbi:MAG: hypothetical protein ABWX82_01080 [Leifsonia sp.]